ncbi:SDR family oxidoreductase [Nocardia jejuensis]|uniref:SDR family oxidoreductase n=1 Tax=Nocardia jejuensis TaxID=328049 RepID=UPI00082C9ADE|nr:SDR family oxidoreductase [Nocardia jejuensis]
MSVPFDYSGRTVFVAGGTSGINLTVAQAFAEAGAAVAVLSRNPDKVNSAVAAIGETGSPVIGFVGDVRDYDSVAGALAAARHQLGGLDVIISGAAGNFPAAARDMSPRAFAAVVDIDLKGTFNVLRAAHEHLRTPGAAVINISAPQSSIPMELQSHACAAKAGVDMLTRVCALEWGSEGIRVNAVVPGPIAETEGMARLAPTPELSRVVAESVPLGRYGTTREIADCCLWLASPSAAYITGAIIPVDGGWSLGGASQVFTAMRALLTAPRPEVTPEQEGAGAVAAE